MVFLHMYNSTGLRLPTLDMLQSISVFRLALPQPFCGFCDSPVISFEAFFKNFIL